MPKHPTDLVSQLQSPAVLAAIDNERGMAPERIAEAIADVLAAQPDSPSSLSSGGDWHFSAIRMGRRWYATRFHPSTEDNDGDLPDVGDTEFWEAGEWHPYSIAAFQERERAAGTLGQPATREEAGKAKGVIDNLREAAAKCRDNAARAKDFGHGQHLLGEANAYDLAADDVEALATHPQHSSIEEEALFTDEARDAGVDALRRCREVPRDLADWEIVARVVRAVVVAARADQGEGR